MDNPIVNLLSTSSILCEKESRFSLCRHFDYQCTVVSKLNILQSRVLFFCLARNCVFLEQAYCFGWSNAFASNVGLVRSLSLAWSYSYFPASPLRGTATAVGGTQEWEISINLFIWVGVQIRGLFGRTGHQSDSEKKLNFYSNSSIVALLLKQYRSIPFTARAHNIKLQKWN